jgi:hypothetical protein|tara:strand:- start:19 stop:285 length:267 start_codon:yes stop_codon:yes gene_type:complete
MKNWFKKLFISSNEQRLKNLEIQVIYLHTVLSEMKQIVDKQSEIIAQMAHVQADISNIIWSDVAKNIVDEKSISQSIVISDTDDEFIN